MDMDNIILHAYDFDDMGKARLISDIDDIHDKLQSKSLAWAHLDGTNPNTAQWLRLNIDYLDHIIIDALLAEETRPRITFYDKGAMVILRGMNFNHNSCPEDMISIRLWIDESRIISIQRRPLKAVEDIVTKIEKGLGPRNSGDFLGALSESLFARMQPVLTDIAERIDTIEEIIIDKADAEMRQELNNIRRQTLIFKRYIAPQKDVMATLRNAEQTWIKKNHLRIFQENQDRLIRYVEELDMLRERSQIIKEEFMAALSDQMNRNMYSLSIIAGIFLPLGFLTGLLGVNVAGMPGTESEQAFWIVVGLCILCGFGFIGLFKYLKWI